MNSCPKYFPVYESNMNHFVVILEYTKHFKSYCFTKLVTQFLVSLGSGIPVTGYRAAENFISSVPLWRHVAKLCYNVTSIRCLRGRSNKMSMRKNMRFVAMEPIYYFGVQVNKLELFP